MVSIRIAALLALPLCPVAPAKDKPTYPEHGTVIAMRTERVATGGRVYTDPYGKTRGGGVQSAQVPVFKIRTKGMDYEIEGRHNIPIDQEVNFRIDKRKVYVQRGEKEDRYALVGQEKRDPAQF